MVVMLPKCNYTVGNQMSSSFILRNPFMQYGTNRKDWRFTECDREKNLEEPLIIPVPDVI